MALGHCQICLGTRMGLRRFCTVRVGLSGLETPAQHLSPPRSACRSL